MARGVSTLTIAASGGTPQAASSQTGKPGQTGDGKPGQTGANRGQCQITPFPKGPEPPLASTGKRGPNGANRRQCQITPFPKGPEPPLASTGDLAGAGADPALALAQCAPQRLRYPMDIHVASPPESVPPTPLPTRRCAELLASILR